MNLLDLMVKIGVDDQASGRIGSIASGITGTVGGIAKVGATAFAAVGAAAVGATGVIVKQALDAYSSYEQNVGGIQKLFGNMGKSVEEYAALTGQSTAEIGDKWQTLEDSQNKVLSNAQNAYKTAGLSANAYMEQVTSFSAALISSLGGDTVKAADYADMAMVDMADNANTFGTSIGDIQNAYQGFAKQNYTMLDNLKLGYGGTQQEMQRLIQDASKMTDVQQKLGVTVDSSSMSFDNIVAAIHVMQESMQIGGTTAREASTTIEGSVSAMKAAWDNWLVGLGDDSANISALTGQLVDSAVVAASNIVPRVSQIVGTLVGELPSIVSQAGPVLSEAFAEIGSAAVSSLRASLGGDNPIASLATEAVQAITGLVQVVETATTPWEAFGLAAAYAVNEVTEHLPEIGEVAPSVLQSLVDGILGGIGALSDVAVTLMSSLGGFISENGGQLIESGVGAVLQLSEGIRENAGQMVDAALQLAVGLAQGLADGLPALIENVPLIVTNIAGVINDNAPKILETGIQIVITLATGLINAIPTLIANVPQIIQAFVSVWEAFSWLDLGSKAITALGNGIKAMGGFITSAGKSIVDFVVNVIKNLPSTLRSLGGSAIQAMGNGIRGLASAVVGAASGVISSAVSAVTSFPSRLFSIGKNAVQGLINGIRNMAGSVVGAITGVVSSAVESAKNFLGIHSPSRVFAEIGRFSMLGMEQGVEGETRGLVSAVADAMDAAQKAAGLVLAPSVDVGDYGTITYQNAPLAASGGVTYNLYVDGLSVSSDGDMAEAVQEFARQIRRAASI